MAGWREALHAAQTRPPGPRRATGETTRASLLEDQRWALIAEGCNQRAASPR